MEAFWKVTGGILLASILWITLKGRESDISVVFTIAVCCMALSIVIGYLEPVFSLMRELEKLGPIKEGILEILLKAAGIGLVAEIAGMVCADAGNGAMGKVMHMLGSSVILYLSIPMFRTLIALMQEILGIL